MDILHNGKVDEVDLDVDEGNAKEVDVALRGMPAIAMHFIEMHQTMMHYLILKSKNSSHA